MSELLHNWVGDVEMHLCNAGPQDDRFSSFGIELGNQCLKKFEAEDERITET